MAEFSKLLTNTDIQKRLSLPTKFFKSLPSFEGVHAVSFEAMDEGGFVWTFQCYTREEGHPKPVLSKGWLEFVRSKKLQVGDTIRFSVLDQTVLREKEVRIYGAIFGPIIAPPTPWILKSISWKAAPLYSGTG